MNQESITTLNGIGEKTAKLFAKAGVTSVGDLLEYYPRAYDTYREPVKIMDVLPDTTTAVCGRLDRQASVKRFNHLQIVSVHLTDDSGRLPVIWYNMPFLKVTLKAGLLYVFRGRVVKKGGSLRMEQPEIFEAEAYGKLMNSMRPVYVQTRGLNNKTITKAVEQALENRPMERDFLPSEIRRRQELAESNFAIEHIHFPSDEKELLFARKRLVFDEFFLFMMAVKQLKEKRVDQKSSYPFRLFREVERLKEELPYDLTNAQERTLSEVFSDLGKGLVMNRLVQGDVGSGKTIVALLALLQAAYNGYQGAIMVPTEVLAKQHFESICRLLDTHGIAKRAVLLTGSMTAGEKRAAREQIASHEADIIVGTHALIQEKVVYDQLALVVTDEQHRFGVHQREAFAQKGGEPHVLVMSATPIPRTLAIILYGDLDISVIDELPSDRLPIKNCVVGTSYRKNAYAFIRKEVAAGRQAYVICPMVENSEMIEAENVLDYSKSLSTELPGVTVEYLHGKMKPNEKNAVMERFSANEIQVLVSTTVIEVGVNVPNATVMMIENAERFGLAQLHQLRGRVGRGTHQSYCILVSGSEGGETLERLEILNRSNDGFYIASEDLKLRGPGDIFGVRQSGDLEFRLADIFTDADILKTVSEEVGALLEEDPELKREEHEELKRRMDALSERFLTSSNL